MNSSEQKGQILDAIAKANGGKLTPELVVLAARNPEHPLHGEFDWDDASAAHQHRLSTARAIIRSVRINVVVQNRVVAVFRYVRDPRAQANEQSYIALVNPNRLASHARSILLAELDRIESAIIRAQKVAAGLGLEADLDALLAKLLSIRAKLPKQVKSAA
jgi:hypothetical protein